MSVVSVSKHIQSYKDLIVWQRSVDLAVSIYEQTARFPDNQKYGLSKQIERAAVSVSSNIAEGAGRKGTKEFIQYLSIAKGSLFELETQLIIASKIGFLSNDFLNSIVKEIEQIGKMLNGLKRSLETNN